ncbi:MAG: hypothetical protein HY866_23790 [Chloroflexi bacterium]|nr:hypothetical protein [Chloroflexota bacterium]
MSAEATIFAIVLAGAMAVFVLFPFMARRTPAEEISPVYRLATPHQRQILEALSAEKARTVRAIRDLDFDYDVGKLDTATYRTQRVYLIQVYMAIVQRLDDIEAEIHTHLERIEAEIAAFRHVES